MEIELIDATHDGMGGHTETPFMRFWAAINEARKAMGRNDITFGPAHRLWEEAKDGGAW